MLKNGISIIIPTYNRSFLLEKTLASLVHQDLDKNSYEILVIDDGSSDDTEAVTRTFSDKVNIKYFFQVDRGFRVAKARNIGIKNAVYDTVLFFDSGMLAEPTLLSKHLHKHQSKKDHVFIGLAYGFEEYETTNFDRVSKIIENNTINDAIELLSEIGDYKDCRDSYLKSYSYDISGIDIPWMILWTCHVSCPTHLLHSIGGFDEFFASWGGEDVELGIRLQKKSAKFSLIRGAKAIHYPHPQNKDDRRDSSLKNCLYMNDKHKLLATKLLSQGYDWREILEIYRLNKSSQEDPVSEFSAA